MDKTFLEFWGNLLISVARGQKQVEDMTKWINQGFSGVDEMMESFTRAYGLKDVPQGPGDREEPWNKMFNSFQQSYREYLKLLEVVPRAEYEQLQEENDSLKKRIVDLERAIGDLHALLAQKIQTTPREVIEEFQKGFLNYLEKLQEVMSPFADGPKGTKEMNQSSIAENDKA